MLIATNMPAHCPGLEQHKADNESFFEHSSDADAGRIILHFDR